jgi:hypothetical protein
MVVSTWLTAMVSFGTRMKWKSGLCPTHHPSIHPSIYLGWCAGGSGGGRCWFPSLAMLRSYTVNSHVVGRNLNLFDPQKALGRSSEYLDMHLLFGAITNNAKKTRLISNG